MSASLQDLKAQLTSLSAADRYELAYFLLTEFESEEDDQAAIDSAWETEILRRLDEIKSGKDLGKPGEQVFAEIRGRRQ